MKTFPKVSVLMPNYNAWKYISEAIQGILSQTFTDFEFIIIDDCSTDNSWEIIQEFAKKDERIVAMRNDENLKICKTLNKGLELAKWEYIARMDSDDVAMDIWLENVYQKISQNEKIGVCGSNFWIIDSNGKILKEKTFPETEKEAKNAIWLRNPFSHPSVIFRKSCYEEFGWYDDNFLYAEDLELWIRYGQKYEFYNIQKNLVKYRIFGENSILKKQKQMIKNTLLARKKAKKLGYKMNLKARFYYFGTWCMQFLPPKFVLWLFNKLQG